jgi:cell filamentation protein, protein adenylyltransferase
MSDRHPSVIDINAFHAGEVEHGYQYKTFLPSCINAQWLMHDQYIPDLLEEASRLLGELNAYSQLIPNVDFFIQMYISKEAVSSNKIEGTQTNLEEALQDLRNIAPERRNDWLEVNNYIKAANTSLKNMRDLPLSNRLIRQAHEILLTSARGEHRQPGKFRTSQNWIGTSLANATFIPPRHEHVPELMSDLEKFMHNRDVHLPHLIRIAIIHYQLETIHPFLDGNGRMGRLLITLYLLYFGLLQKPTLYLSDFFMKNKEAYYDRLMAVRTHNKLSEWIQFFLTGVQETARHSINVFREIASIRAIIEAETMPQFQGSKLKNAQTLMYHLYGAPVVTNNAVAALLNVNHNIAAALVKDFVSNGILKEITGRYRNKIFIFDAYFKLF